MQLDSMYRLLDVLQTTRLPGDSPLADALREWQRDGTPRPGEDTGLDVSAPSIDHPCGFYIRRYPSGQARQPTLMPLDFGARPEEAEVIVQGEMGRRYRVQLCPDGALAVAPIGGENQINVRPHDRGVLLFEAATELLPAVRRDDGLAYPVPGWVCTLTSSLAATPHRVLLQGSGETKDAAYSDAAQRWRAGGHGDPPLPNTPRCRYRRGSVIYLEDRPPVRL